MEVTKQEKHFVLVHGMSHGAWCWYKLIPLLKKAGHRVTALDMAASGVNMWKMEDVLTFEQYNKPLLDFMLALPDDEKVILVGHSLGGMNIALAMEHYPQKVSVAVFLTAFLPDTINDPSFVVEKLDSKLSQDGWMGSQILTYGPPEHPFRTVLLSTTTKSHKLNKEYPFNHPTLPRRHSHRTTTVQPPSNFIRRLIVKPPQPHLILRTTSSRELKQNIYCLSPAEDIELSMALQRPGSLFLTSLAKAKKLSNNGYGSVRKVYIISKEDKGITEEFARFMIGNAGATEVIEIEDADHMTMLSQPQKLCDCLTKL